MAKSFDEIIKLFKSYEDATMLFYGANSDNSEALMDSKTQRKLELLSLVEHVCNENEEQKKEIASLNSELKWWVNEYD